MVWLHHVLASADVHNSRFVSVNGCGRVCSVPSVLVHVTSTGLVEEALKLAMVRWRCCPEPFNWCHPPEDPVTLTPATRLASARQLLILMTSAALGFSTVETMLYSTSGDAGCGVFANGKG
jgi:RsiW-degrading membrane proteinase PrsW (M82 family)